MMSSSGGFKRVGVVGLGLMGHGITQITAQAGYEVLAIESQDSALSTGMKRIESSLEKTLAREMKKGLLTEGQVKDKHAEIMSRIQTTTKLEQAHDCDLIVEVIVENMEIKMDFFKNLGKIIKPEAVFASNTSSLPVTAMALASGRPDKFVGLHFFNPVQIMKLLEVIRTQHTSDDAFDRVTQFGKDIGKATVSANDTPGFIVNRLLVPYLMQAMSMVDRGDATVADIDVSMQLGAGHPMGPLHLADYIGLDTCLNIVSGWQKDFPNESAFSLPECLAVKVSRGELGRKSGKGFYNWSGDKVLGPV